MSNTHTEKATKHNTSNGQWDELVCEASDLRLPPGVWPMYIPTDLGNGQNFRKHYATHREGDKSELVSVTYVQMLGCLWLTVYND